MSAQTNNREHVEAKAPDATELAEHINNLIGGRGSGLFVHSVGRAGGVSEIGVTDERSGARFTCRISPESKTGYPGLRLSEWPGDVAWFGVIAIPLWYLLGIGHAPGWAVILFLCASMMAGMNCRRAWRLIRKGRAQGKAG